MFFEDDVFCNLGKWLFTLFHCSVPQHINDLSVNCIFSFSDIVCEHCNTNSADIWHLCSNLFTPCKHTPGCDSF